MINKRIFGSDIDPRVKGVLKARQKLAGQSKPGESVSLTGFNPLDPNEITVKPISEFIPNSNFLIDGDIDSSLVDLYSKTPFIRMWTAVSLQEYQTADDDTDANNCPDYDYDMDLLTNPLPLDPEIYKKVYVVGNYDLDTLEKLPNIPISDTVDEAFNSDDTNVSDLVLQTAQYNQADLTFPSEHNSQGFDMDGETRIYDMNQFMKPQAGITSLQSSTEGNLGVIKKTTVNFTVHNFADYQKIFSRYFLRPGAQLFVDFGWDTANLYHPDDIIDPQKLEELGYENIEHALYGEAADYCPPRCTEGFVTKAMGNLETVHGIVTDYDSKILPNGSVECTVTITSKNMSIMGLRGKVDPLNNSVERIKQMLEHVIYFDAILKLTDKTSTCYETEEAYNNKDPNGIKKSSNGDDMTDVTYRQCQAVGGFFDLDNDDAAYSKILNNLPNKEFTATDYNEYKKSVIHYAKHKMSTIHSSYLNPQGDAIATGVHMYKGQTEETYISWGLLEDLILNPEFGFGEDTNDINNGNNFNVRFDSSNSFTTFNKILYEQQEIIADHLSGKDSFKRVTIYPRSDGFIAQKLLDDDLAYLYIDPDDVLLKKVNYFERYEYETNVSTVYDNTYGWNLSYNTIKGKIPSIDAYNLFLNENDQWEGLLPNQDDNELYNNPGISSIPDGEPKFSSNPYDTHTKTHNFDFNRTDYDISLSRIPIREVFVRVDTILNAFGLAESGADAFSPTSLLSSVQKILEDINEKSYGIFDWRMTSSGDNSKVKIVDNNVLNLEHRRQALGDDREFNNMFMFDIMSNNSIVNGYDLSFKMPEDKVGDMYAIQALSSGNQLDQMKVGRKDLDMIMTLEEIEQGDFNYYNQYIQYEPNPGMHKVENISSDQMLFKFHSDTFNRSVDSILANEEEWDQSIDGIMAPDTADEYALFGDHVNRGPDGTNAKPDSWYFCNNQETWEDDVHLNNMRLRNMDFCPDCTRKNLVMDNGDNEKSLVNTIQQQFAYEARGLFLDKIRPTPLPIYLTLSIYGISTLIPGDVFRVNYLPQKYLRSVYFQIIKVKHEVSTGGWITILETQFRSKAEIVEIKQDCKKDIWWSPIALARVTDTLTQKNNCVYQWWQDKNHLQFITGYTCAEQRNFSKAQRVSRGYNMNIDGLIWYGTPFKVLSRFMWKIKPVTGTSQYQHIKSIFSFEIDETEYMKDWETQLGQDKGDKTIYYPVSVYGTSIDYDDDCCPRPYTASNYGLVRVFQGYGHMHDNFKNDPNSTTNWKGYHNCPVSSGGWDHGSWPWFMCMARPASWSSYYWGWDDYQYPEWKADNKKLYLKPNKKYYIVFNEDHEFTAGSSNGLPQYWAIVDPEWNGGLEAYNIEMLRSDVSGDLTKCEGCGGAVPRPCNITATAKSSS